MKSKILPGSPWAGQIELVRHVYCLPASHARRYVVTKVRATENRELP